MAVLYYKEGMLSKCVEECDDLILWFSEGEYVIKSMELKMRIQPLTASQEEKYRQLISESKAEQIQVKPVNMDAFNTTNLQEALAESLQSLIQAESAQEPDSEPAVKLEQERDSEPFVKLEQDVIEETAAAPSAQAEFTEIAAETIAPVPQAPKFSITRDTLNMPKFLGQDASGQLTFDMQENVLERQITGQLSIEDIMNSWEEKKKETEAAIAEAAKKLSGGNWRVSVEEYHEGAKSTQSKLDRLMSRFDIKYDDEGE